MPSKNQEFATYCCDLLGAIGPCVIKRMFGGFGISLEGLSLAFVLDLGQGEKLWLKANDDTRTPFDAAGCERFSYARKGVVSSINYYCPPEEAMDSREFMAPWARLALEAALKAAASKAGKSTGKTARKTAASAKRDVSINANAKTIVKAKPKLQQSGTGPGRATVKRAPIVKPRKNT